MPEGREVVHVRVDHREKPCPVYRFLEEAGCSISFEQLPMGDYLIGDRLVFERKTLNDFARSIIDGRLFRQARLLAHSALIPVLLLEGAAESLRGCQMSRESMQGALISISLIYGIPVLRSLNHQESAWLMVFAARQTTAGRRKPLQLNRSRCRAKDRMQVRFLEGLPGVGPVRGRALLDRFGTIQRVVAAPAKELCQVEGIGPVTAERIRWLVG